MTARPRPVVVSTPALEAELLHRLALKGGAASLALMFDRRCGTWPQPAPTWAILAAEEVIRTGLVEEDPEYPNKLAITEAGKAQVGRRRTTGARS